MVLSEENETLLAFIVKSKGAQMKVKTPLDPQLVLKILLKKEAARWKIQRKIAR